jgi:hypothetical protein
MKLTDKTLMEILYLKMEKSEDNNIFNNMNNFSRDEFVFEETVKLCTWFMEDLLEERDRYRKGMQHFYGRLMEKDNETNG